MKPFFITIRYPGMLITSHHRELKFFRLMVLARITLLSDRVCFAIQPLAREQTFLGQGARINQEL